METPDVTAVQKLVAAVVAAVPVIGTLLMAFGIEVTAAQIGAISGAIAALGGIYVLADAIIRNGRSRVLAAQKAEKPYDSVVGR
jgi:hypothetical protein